MAPLNSQRPLTDSFWVRLFFTYPALSPVAWTICLLVSFVLLLWAAFRLIPGSFPHWLMFGLMLLAAWLTSLIETRIYRALGPLYQGGWMPSLQKTLLSLGLFSLFAVVGYLFLVQMVLGIISFVALLFYTWRYQAHTPKKRNVLEAFSELVNSQERLEAPGMRQFEILCLWACLLVGLCAGAGALDKFVTIGHPVYQVRLLGKEVRRGGKGGVSYILNLSGWRNKRPITLNVTRDEFDQLYPATDYKMQTRRGLFGTERLDSFQILARPDAQN